MAAANRLIDDAIASLRKRRNTQSWKRRRAIPYCPIPAGSGGSFILPMLSCVSEPK